MVAFWLTLLTCLFQNVIGITNDDINLICNQNSSVAALNPLKNYVPKIFLKIDERDKFLILTAKNFSSCTNVCCRNVECNSVVFSTDRSECFNIECNFDDDSCLAVDSNVSSFLFLRVRNKTEEIKTNFGRSCDETVPNDCPNGLICVRSSSNDVALCHCPYGSHITGNKCQQLTQNIANDDITKNEPKSCTVGLIDDCSPGEECVVNEYRLHAKRGKCQRKCEQGISRNSQGLCLKSNEIGLIFDSNSTTNDDKKFTIEIDGPSIVQLPISEVSLNAKIMPVGDNLTMIDDVKYEWNIVSTPNFIKDGKKVASIAGGRDSKTFRLTELEVGEYLITLKASLQDFSTYVNFTLIVQPPVLPNKPPKAVVVPPEIETEENKKVILDGSQSKDEEPGRIVEWKWTQIDGPIIDFGGSARNPTLTFDKLLPGNYTFKLTVKDDSGNEDSASTWVTVHEEVDYPPKAEAGSCDSKLSGDIEVRLPVESIFICGNSSSDDKGIVKWKWLVKDTTKNTADMEGTSSSVLKISRVQAGDYSFTLEVEDIKGQKSTADVRVFVRKAENKFPVAESGPNVTISYPESSVILDGNQSSDDGRLVSYHWSQKSGPNEAKMTNVDNVRMTASDLVRGVYIFRLNVTDDGGLSSVDDVFVTVDESRNSPPIAKASNVSVILPCTLALLNGSSSTDDAGIVRWRWKLLDETPAGLVLLGDTYQQPVLLITHFKSAGVFRFNFTVYDKQDAWNSTVVFLNVIESDKEKELIEVYVKTKLKFFTMKNQRKFVKQLSALLATNKIWDEVDITITDVSEDPTTGRTRILLFCEQIMASTKSYLLIKAVDVVDYLNDHLSDSDMLIDFDVDKFDTKYCRNDCSGHGRCDDYTKLCTCERYWMPNFFKSRFPRRSNCDWSVLYFVLVVLLLGVLIVGSTFATFCCFGKKSCRRSSLISRTRKYRTLHEFPLKKGYNWKKVRGKNGYTHFAESDSDSLLSSEEETVYDKSTLLKNKRASNGVEA